jgi:basic amino acid/polyamine antiporter, APA family
MSEETEEVISACGLRVCLTLWDATAIGVGAIIGSGIFVVTGVAAGQAGSALVISILIASVVSILTALGLVELTSWKASEGGVYEYVHQLVSPTAGFLTGWMWVVSNLLGGAVVALGFGYYLSTVLNLPPQVIGAVATVVFTALNYRSASGSSKLNNGLVAVKLLILAFFIAFGVLFVQPANFVPFLPLSTGVLLGAYFIFFAFSGFARVAIVSEEVFDARRNVPRAILLALLISVIYYVLVGTVAIGLTGAPALATSNSPLAFAMSATGFDLAVYIITVGGLIATASVLLTSILGVSRVLFAMARRGELPRVLGRVHPTNKTPYIAVLVTGAINVLVVLSLDIVAIIVLSTFAQLFYYIMSNLAAWRRPAPRRYSRAVPFLGMLSCVGLLSVAVLVSAISCLEGLAVLGIGLLWFMAVQRSKKRGVLEDHGQ